MKRRMHQSIALGLCISLLLQWIGCSSTERTVANAHASTGAGDRIATRDLLYTLDTSTEVTVLLKDGSTLRGRFEGIGPTGAREVIMVLPKHLPDVAESFEQWVPTQGEPIIVYMYPSYEVYMEGRMDLEDWRGNTEWSSHAVQFMTPRSAEPPQFDVRIRYIPQYGTFTYVSKISYDRIQEIRIDPDQPMGKVGQAAIGVGILAVGAVVIGAIVTGAAIARWGFR